MARDGLQYELANAFQKALSQTETVVLENIVLDHDGGKQFVKVTIQPISGSNALAGMFLAGWLVARLGAKRVLLGCSAGWLSRRMTASAGIPGFKS